MERFVTEFEFIDHGVDHAQYFQGCGVAFTTFDAYYTGCGDSAREAAEDAIEQSIMSGDVWQSLASERAQAMIDAASDEALPEDAEETYHYVSVRVRYARD